MMQRYSGLIPTQGQQQAAQNRSLRGKAKASQPQHLAPRQSWRQLWLGASMSLLLAACGQSELTPGGSQQGGYASRAESYIKAGQYRAAHIELSKGAKDDGLTVAERNELAFARAQWFDALGQHQAVIESITSVPLADRTVEMQTQLLMSYLDAGKLFSAEGMLEASSEPALPEQITQFARAKIALARGKHAQAMKLYADLSAFLPESALSPSEGKALPPPSELYVKTRLGVATSHLALKNTVEAETVVLSLLAQYPDLVPGLMAKANLATLRGDFESAEDALSTALISLPETDIMEPQKFKVLSAFVALLTRQGRTAEALTYSKILAEHHPEATELKGRLDSALALWREGKLPEAQKALINLYQQSPNDRIGSLVGLISFLNGDQETANEYFERHIDPEIANANMLLAMTRVFVQAGRLEETVGLIEQAHLNNPKNGRITTLLGALRLSNGNPAGFSIMEQGLKQNPKQKQMWVALAQARDRIQNDRPKAIKTLQAARLHFPEDTLLRRALVTAMQGHGQVKEAQALVDSFFKEDGETLDNLLLAATTALSQRELKRGRQYLDKARNIEAKNVSVLRGLILTDIAEEKFSQAKTLALELIEVDPNTISSYRLFTQAQAKLTPDTAEIRQALTDVIDQYKTAAGYTALFDVEFANRDFEAAGKALEEARAQDPSFNGLSDRSAGLAYSLGRQALAEGKYQEAREHLVLALRYRPKQVDLNTLLIRLELELGNDREAEKLLAQLPENSLGESTRAQLNAELAIKRGDFAIAESMLLKVWGKEPSDATAQALYKTYQQQKKDAVPFLKEWQAKSKAIPATLFLAHELVTSGQYPAAISEYEKIFPDIERNAQAMNNLAWAYLQTEDERARTTAKAAVELAPNDPMVLDTYGVILLKEGEKAEAKRILGRAHELAPENEEIKANWKRASE